MHFVRFSLRWSTSIFLHVSLLLFVLSLSLVLVFDKNSIKSNLLSSGVYEDAVPAIIADNAKQSEGVTGAFPADDPQVQQIALDSFTRDVLQKQTEEAIDSVYAWLDGSREDLSFSVTLKEPSQNFISNVSVYAATRLQDKAICTTEDITQITVFDLPCKPEDVPLSYIVNVAKQNLENSNLFKDMQWSEEDLPKTKDGTGLAEKYSYVPTVYQVFTERIYVFVFLFIVAVVLFVYVRRPLRKGMKALGKDLLSNGLTVIVATAIFGFILPRVTQNASLQTTETTKLMTNVSDTFIKSFDTLVINTMLQVVAVAIIILALEKMSRRTSLYGSLQKKTGLTTSKQTLPKTSAQPSSLKARPPVQTSEAKSKNKSTSKKTKKYRKMGL